MSLHNIVNILANPLMPVIILIAVFVWIAFLWAAMWLRNRAKYEKEMDG